MAGAGLLSPSLLNSLKVAAIEAGFGAASGVDLDLAWPLFQEHVRHYDQWLALGHSAEMHYLVRGRDRRADPRLVFSDAQSVFCVLEPYRKAPAGNLDPSRGPRYARYLDGPDYHERIATRLDGVMSAVSQKYPELHLSWKTCVDTSAVLERSWAALSGLGWIGKNTLLIHPQLGSYVFIGVVLLSEKLGKAPELLPDYCGNCTRCIQGCPTGAIEAPHSLNSNRCIAYWTLEKRGELQLSPQDQKSLGSWIAGCDLCQEVCPFNTKPSRQAARHPESEPRFENSPLRVDSWEELENETVEAYRARVKGTALSRVKPDMFRRNLQLTHLHRSKHKTV